MAQKIKGAVSRNPARTGKQPRTIKVPPLSGVRMRSLRESLFEEDVMLPEQYFGRLRQKADFPAEQQLLLAVLEDAVHCFQANLFARTVRRQQAFEEAEEWLLAPDMDAAVTLEYVCDVFGFDAECMRAGLRKWRDSQRGTDRAVAGSSTATRDGRRPLGAPIQLAVSA